MESKIDINVIEELIKAVGIVHGPDAASFWRRIAEIAVEIDRRGQNSSTVV